jgi:hypothetical protein
MTFIQPALGKTLRYQYKSDVVVTNSDRDPEKIREFRGDKSIGRDQRWDQIIDPGDASFWSGFNYLPIEESLHHSIPSN